MLAYILCEKSFNLWMSPYVHKYRRCNTFRDHYGEVLHSFPFRVLKFQWNQKVNKESVIIIHIILPIKDLVYFIYLRIISKLGQIRSETYVDIRSQSECFHTQLTEVRKH